MDLILRRNIYRIISVSFLLLFHFGLCFPHSLNGHNKELEKILFGDGYSKVTDNGKKNFRLLCEAAFLTLDYTSDNDSRNSGSRFALDLSLNGVKNVPPVSSISFPANQYHQMYTHYGWKKGYRGLSDRANWSLRKSLLLSTVKKIGDFDDDEKIKQDAFAAIVYEMHILGDHIGDKEQTRDTRLKLVSEPGYHGSEVSPTSDGPFNTPTLYTYLLYHIQRLFRDQKNTYEYTQIIAFLNRHKNEFLNCSSYPVPYDDINFLAKKTRDELIRYLPRLLEREAFFQRAFFR